MFEPSRLTVHTQQANDKDRHPNQKGDDTSFLYEVRHRGKSKTPERQEEAGQQNQAHKGYPGTRPIHADATIRAHQSRNEAELSAPRALGWTEGLFALGAEPSADKCYIGSDKRLAIWCLAVEIQSDKEKTCPEGH